MKKQGARYFLNRAWLFLKKGCLGVKTLEPSFSCSQFLTGASLFPEAKVEFSKSPAWVPANFWRISPRLKESLVFFEKN
jgi:hypothetical protein